MSADVSLGLGGRIGRRLREGADSMSNVPTSFQRTFLVGHDDAGRPVHMPWPDGGDGMLYLVPGARGTGKTAFLSRMQEAVIAEGWSLITIQGAQNDPALRREGAKRWTVNGPTPYNPFAHGSDIEIADQVLAGETWSETHYLRQAQLFIIHLVNVLRARGIEISLASIADNFDRDRLLSLAEAKGELNRDYSLELNAAKRYLRDLDAAQLNGLKGTRARLSIIPASSMGRWWEAGPDSINLWEDTQRGETLHFVLDGDGIQLLSEMISRAITMDLNSLISRRANVLAEGGELKHLFVMIDEFGAAATDLSSIVDRGRYAETSLVLAAQDLYSHTAKVEGLGSDLIANVTAMISLREQSRLSAQMVSALAGDEEIPVSSWDEKKRTRTQIEERPRIAVDQLLHMPNYHAAVIIPGAEEAERARIARLVPPR